MEGAFRHFGGVPYEVLVDNARALVDEHDQQTREVKFNDRFHAFCRYWGVLSRACAPYSARTKGKDERGVGYVKRNAIAGHRFDSIEALQAHLAGWMRAVADTRTHGTTGEPPIQRFERAEAAALKPLAAKAPFLQVRELTRRVHTDACIELDTSQLQRLATSLQSKHPGAAASLREGLEETLTVQELGITGALYRTLRTTNPIENLNGSVARYCRNVKRWGDGQMVLRWVASALTDAAHRTRKLRGCSQMRSLLKALDARRPEAETATLRKAAEQRHPRVRGV